jgi:hypothetical protein
MVTRAGFDHCELNWRCNTLEGAGVGVQDEL